MPEACFYALEAAAFLGAAALFDTAAFFVGAALAGFVTRPVFVLVRGASAAFSAFSAWVESAQIEVKLHKGNTPSWEQQPSWARRPSSQQEPFSQWQRRQPS